MIMAVTETSSDLNDWLEREAMHRFGMVFADLDVLDQDWLRGKAEDYGFNL